MEEWQVLYDDALHAANADPDTELKIHAWALLCTFGPPSDGFPLNRYPDLPMEDDFWAAPVEGTALIAEYLIVPYERLIIVRRFA